LQLLVQLIGIPQPDLGKASLPGTDEASIGPGRVGVYLKLERLLAFCPGYFFEVQAQVLALVAPDQQARRKFTPTGEADLTVCEEPLLNGKTGDQSLLQCCLPSHQAVLLV